MNNSTRFIQDDLKFTYSYVKSLLINDTIEPFYTLGKVDFFGVDMTEWCQIDEHRVYDLDELEELVYNSIEKFVKNSA